MGKSWNIAESFPAEYKKRFKDYGDIITQVLYNRGIKDQSEADSFFNPNYEKMHDPFLLPDIKKATKRVISAIEKKERIVVFGDYDVDGVTATAIVYKTLESIGADVGFYIPHRMKEGYGLNKKAIDILSENKTSLIITVDNGISNKDEVSYAKSKGIDIIVTDHHEVPDILPKSIAIINPKRKDSKYPFKDLAGVGVAFKFSLALMSDFKEKNKKDGDPLGQMKWYLDLAALGTISDMVPLIGENRIIAYYGLIVLSKTKNIGLRALEKIAGIDLEKSSPYTIGFQIGPRLNSAGRIDHASVSLELLLSQDKNEAEMLALKLEQFNKERQEVVSKSMDELRVEYSKKQIEKIILLKSNDWTAGIIGLIAGRMSEEFSRPVFCMSEENGLIKGSVRSSVDFNVVENLRVFEKVFINYGGHYGAGGFSLKSEDYDFFYKQIISYGEEKLDEGSLIGILNIEKEIELDDINSSLFDMMKRFQPFGHGNEEPVFTTKQVKIKEVKRVGKDSLHTKMKLVKNKKEIDAILFNHGDLKDSLYYGKEVDIAYKIDLNEWNGNKKLELRIEDIKV